MKPKYLQLVTLGLALATTSLQAGDAIIPVQPATPTPAAEETTLFPIPTLGGDPWTRDVMTGDWGGARQRLADNGIQLDVTLHQYYQSVVDGGRDIDSWGDNGSLDYRIKLDTGKAGWWPGGFIELHAETYYGTSANRNTGSIIPTNTDFVLSAPDGEGTYLSHVVVMQFLSESFGIYLGKLDTTVGDMNAFAHGSGDEKFQSLAFSFNPVTLLSAPYSTLGAGFVWLPAEGVTVTGTVYDLEGDISTSGFDTAFDGGTGYNAEVQFTTNFFGQPGHQLVGASWANGDFTALSDPRLILPRLMARTEDSTWNVYYNFDQYLCHDKETGRGWGIFGRVGIADEDTNPIPLFVSAGVGGTGLFASRPQDRFGIGYYYLETSDQLPGLLLEDSEQGVELFYDFAVTPWFRVAANLQVIEPALKTADTATVFGLRSTVTF